MNPNLTQSRRDAVKERRGHGRLDRERLSTVITAKPHDSLVGLARRCRPKPQARTRRLQRQERKRNSPLHLGSLKNRTLASRRRTPLSTSLPYAAKQAKKHPMRAILLYPRHWLPATGHSGYAALLQLLRRRPTESPLQSRQQKNREIMSLDSQIPEPEYPATFCAC
jgi:hypothetical protein